METTTSTQHTPGPWMVQLISERWHGYDWPTFAIRDSVGNHCLAVIGDVDRATADKNTANARLIASAPELLAALVTLLDHADLGEIHDEETAAAVNNARAAIAKATGGAQ